MPFENEHACRVLDPEQFTRFVRENGMAEEDGKEIDGIIGFRADDTSDIQAFRYRLEEGWEEEDARRHCEDHDGAFEPATGEGDDEEARARRARVWVKLPERNASRDRVLAEMYEGIWAIRPEALAGLFRQALVLGDLSGGITPGEPAAVARRDGKPREAIAVLPVRGPISQRADFFTMLFGGVTTEELGAQIRALVADPGVSAIVLDVDSPGGVVYGVPELAEELRALRGRKPIIAVADSMAASAAYWIAAQADQVVVSPSSEVGSIGVFSLHTDMSKMLDSMGLKPTFIQFGENKTLGNPFEPLSERAAQEIQKRVDDYGHQFVRAVVQGRGVTEKRVMEGFGQGLMFGARDAVRLGLADRAATLGEVLAELGASAPGSGRKAALRRQVQRAALG